MRPRGFIALMSAILISSTLLVVAAAGSLTGFYTRANIGGSELKEQSFAAADACADQALLGLANDPQYGGGEVRVLDAHSACSVGVVETTPTQKIFTIQATSSGVAVTNLRIIYSISTNMVVSWLEVPNN